MAFGDFIGFRGQGSLPLSPVGDTSLKEGGKELGSIIFEADEELEGYRLLGYTQAAPELNIGGEIIPLADLRAAWEEPLEKVFPVKTQPATLLPSTPPPSASLTPPSRRGANSKPPSLREVPPVGGGGSKTPFLIPNSQLLIPKAVIPVFPGTNCEYDTAAAVGRAGGSSEIISVRNLTPQMLNESIAALEKAIKAAQILIFPGGFSGGDEPDGSAKFIVSLFKNPKLTQAVHELINTRNGLILGICNGFQALVKLGLLPYGEIKEITSNSPTLTFNETVRHQAKYVRTRVVNTSSPWLCECKTDEIYVQPVSHGEGRFVASAQVLEELRANGQIAFQYVDFDGNPSMGPEHNPNGSVWAIEGITSADGRILGKMAHTERYNKYAAMNIPGNKFMPLFESGIKSVNG
ncbi:MAG: phosphoribosylformylglycinamidine synthase subunit PurQ [Oscillospiraceae bacterium]|nr:phosphoribosylformylglycinamidine synthase subunit PurQ [Oscillospiraceae bacterium]